MKNGNVLTSESNVHHLLFIFCLSWLFLLCTPCQLLRIWHYPQLLIIPYHYHAPPIIDYPFYHYYFAPPIIDCYLFIIKIGGWIWINSTENPKEVKIVRIIHISHHWISLIWTISKLWTQHCNIFQFKRKTETLKKQADFQVINHIRSQNSYLYFSTENS